MEFVLRKLDRRAAFHPVDWIQEGDVSADALSNLRTIGNALSVWQIDENTTNLDRVIAALAAGRMKLDKIDYALIDRQALDPLGIRLVKETGGSFDRDANTMWHQDITGLSGSKLLELASTLQTHAKFKRIHRNDVRDLVVASIDDGFIDSTQLDAKLREDLARLE